MGKTLKAISLILISAIFLVGVTDNAEARKKKIPNKPKLSNDTTTIFPIESNSNKPPFIQHMITIE